MAGVCHAFMLDPPNFCLIHSPRSLLMAPVAPRKQAPHHRGRTFLCPPNLHLSLSCYPEISVTASCFAVDHTLQFSLTKASWCCLSASVFYFPLFLCYFSPVCGSYAPPQPPGPSPLQSALPLLGHRLVRMSVSTSVLPHSRYTLLLVPASWWSLRPQSGRS